MPAYTPPPYEMSRADLAQIERMNRDVNWHFPRVREGARSGPRGNCVWNAQMKQWALEQMGIPPSAMQVRDYDVRGAADARHRVVDLHVVVDGRPRTYTLDMNSSWLRSTP